jgi:hypothetical protein
LASAARPAKFLSPANKRAEDCSDKTSNQRPPPDTANYTFANYHTFFHESAAISNGNKEQNENESLSNE